MPSLAIGDRYIGDEYPCFIIAEIGQNHQGSMKRAKELIRKAKASGADCVKFQKSFLTEKFTENALLNTTLNPGHSFGSTYGEHKEFLEFTIEEFKELKEYCDSMNIIFSSSAMDWVSFDELVTLNLPFIKIGSGDSNNQLLLRHAARHPVPLIISTGMINEDGIDRIVNIMKECNKTNFCLLHCISAYPTELKDSKLGMIEHLKMKYPDICIGYSGHEKGLEASLAAVLMGAHVVERHFTFNKTAKGTDHQLSLTGIELSKLILYTRTFEMKNYIRKRFPPVKIIETLKTLNLNIDGMNEALDPVAGRDIYDCELNCMNKLGKTLVYAKDCESGHVMMCDDFKIKVSKPRGCSTDLLDALIGKTITESVYADSPVLLEHYPI